MTDRLQLEPPQRPPPPAAVARPRLAGLDGLRGLAVLAVVAYHFDALRGGFLGVDLFFVVSGFLITRMMIIRRAGGRPVTLRWFWARRARRLFPAVLVLVAVVVAVVERLDGGALLDRTRGQGITGLLYVNNWYDLYAHIGYFDVALGKTPLNHLWSLSIEEQFYVVWPVMFMVFARTRRGFSALMAVTAALVVASMSLAPFWDSREGWARAYLGTDSRVGAILLGALLSLVLTRHELLGTVWRAGWLWCLRLASLGAAVFLAVQWSSADVTSGSLYRGGLAACSLAAAVLVAGVAMDGGRGVGPFFGWRPIAWVGLLSYSLYLWHVPIIVLVNENRTGLSGVRLFGVQMLLIVATTLASYYLIERPIHLEGISLNRSFVAALAGAACLIAIVGLPGLVPGSGAPAPSLASPVRARSFGAAEVQNLTAMVVGDSWGIRTAFGMAQMPDPHPKAVLQLGQASCGITDPVEEYGANGVFTPTARCLAWKTTWADAMRQKPSFVILQVGNWDQAKQRLTPDGDWVTACDPSFKARYEDRFDQAIAILTSGATPVFVATVRDNEDDLRKRSDCMNSMLRSGVERHAAKGVHLLDLQGFLCPEHKCVKKIDGHPTYDDTGHIALETLQAVNRWIFAEVGAVLGTQVPATDLWPAGGTGPTIVTAPGDVAGQQNASALSQEVRGAADALRGPGSAAQPEPSASSAAQVLSSVGAVASRDDYQGVVEKLSASQANAVYQVASSGPGTDRVAGFAYGADSPADSAAVALRQLLLDAGAKVTTDDANLQHFDLGNTTISFRRSWQRLSVTVVTGGDPEARRDRARASLELVA